MKTGHKNKFFCCVKCDQETKRWCDGCGDSWCSKCDPDLNINGKLCKDCRQLLAYGIVLKGHRENSALKCGRRINSTSQSKRKE